MMNTAPKLKSSSSDSDAVREARELRDFVEHLAVPLHWVGEDGTILWANQAELDFLGYSAAEYIGHSIKEFHADNDVICDILSRLTRNEVLHGYEARMRCRDGSLRNVAISSSVYREDDRFVHTRCVTLDMTYKSRAGEIEERLASVVESSADAIVSKDLNGFIQSWNPGAEEMFGYTAEEAIGKHISMLAIPERTEEIPNILDLIKQGKRVEHYETKRRAKDGRVLFISLTESPVLNSAGEIIGASKVARDVTTERLFAETQERLAAIVESSDDAILSKDLDGIIKSWNAGAERLFGYLPEEIIGKHISTLAAPGYVDEIPNILDRIRQGKRVDHYITKRRTKDGRILNISLTVSPIRNSDGIIIGASKVARDITEQLRLSEVQERLAAIVESSDDAIISKDLNGIIQSWNSGAQRLFGYKAEEIIGQHISVLAAPEKIDEIPNILERITNGERVVHYETRRRAKDGRILTVSLTVSPIRDTQGKVIGASKVARDVTERNAQEAALRKANDALTQANSDLQQFAYSASHDLQEPLRTVSTYSEMLRKKFGGKLGPDGDEFIEYTLQGALRMERLLSDLRAYTRASLSGEDTATQLDAVEIFDKAIETLDSVIKESGASITRSELPVVYLHEFQLEHLFQNLIGNAIRYRSSKPPVIHVTGERRETDTLFSVTDNGIGIDPQYKEQIFGIFKRLHSVGDYPGTGMGLAICQKIIERAGGRIWVESELGRGSTFFFTIPNR